MKSNRSQSQSATDSGGFSYSRRLSVSRRHSLTGEYFESFRPEKLPSSKFNHYDAFKIDPTFWRILIWGSGILVVYKLLIISMPYATSESLYEVGLYTMEKYGNLMAWATHPDRLTSLLPIVYGIAFAIFSYLLVYFDSNVPGVNPPSPFSPRSKSIYRRQKEGAAHLGYWTAVGGGLVVTVLMYSTHISTI